MSIAPPRQQGEKVRKDLNGCSRVLGCRPFGEGQARALRFGQKLILFILIILAILLQTVDIKVLKDLGLLFLLHL